MTAKHVSELEILLSQSGWARALARRLVEDASDADDLVQSAYAVALEHSPSRGVPLKSWLASVLRNLARARWRARVRRELRERACARLEGSDPGHELIGRFEQQRVLAEEVAALEEPFQSAILMRYFDGLQPEEIARRTGESVRTVHSRLHRGLARLRERLLRRTGGDARSWMLALFPLGFGRGGIAGSLLGGWIVNTQVKIVAAVVVMGALAVTVTRWPLVDAPRGTPSGSTVAASAVADDPSVPGADDGDVVDGRSTIEPIASAETPAVELAKAAAEAAVSGRVVDSEGAPLAGLEIGLRQPNGSEIEPEPRATSDADGRFVLRGTSAVTRVTLASPDWVAMFAQPMTTTVAAAEVLLVAARALTLSGSVVDESANPIQGAELEYTMPSDMRTRFPALLDGAPPAQSMACSGVPGRFLLLAVPAAPGGKVRVNRVGFEEELVDVPDHSRDDLVIVLRSQPDVAFLPGRVVDAAGDPVDGAVVVLGDANARSDASGSFLLALQQSDGARVIQAVKHGYLPASVECAGDASSDPRAWPDPLVLELGAQPLSIAGVVVDREGRPVPRAQVSIVDRTYLGIIEARFGSERFEAPQWIESELRGGFGGPGFAAADDQGRFRLEGLLQRPYIVQAFDPRSLSHAEMHGVDAGREDVEIRLACTDTLPAIRGRVIGRAGTPVAGALVIPLRTMLQSSMGSEPRFGEIEVSGEGPFTGEDGSFELRSLCSDAVGLRVSHTGQLGSVTVRFDELASLDAVEIVLPMQCHLQVDLEGSAVRADQLRVLDAKGEEMTLVAYHGDVSFASPGFGIEGDKSEAFVVDEDAATLVLLNESEEVARIPLSLRAGELNVIRP